MTYDTINEARTVAGNSEGALLANRYRVAKQLGQGGMGSVWLAEDTQLDDQGVRPVKTCLPTNLLMRLMFIMLLVILGGLFGGCASNSSAGGEVLSGVLMGIGTGLSGL